MQRSLRALTRGCVLSVTSAFAYECCTADVTKYSPPLHMSTCSGLLSHCEGVSSNISNSPASSTSPKEVVLKKIHDIEDQLAHYRPDMKKYDRIDHVIFEEENFKNTIEQHALYSSLHGESRIEAYEIYKSKETEEIYCIIRFGDKINGWPNIVHGGITALIIDNSYGWLFTTYKKPKAVTANLSINYRRPIFANSCSILRAKIDKIEGKKLLMSAVVEDAETRKVQAESTTLFVFMK